jgi:ATP-dependent Clp protease ATP-binding subunit ClpX
MKADGLDTCSFCGKHKDSVTKLIVGGTAAICNECVNLCENLLQDQADTSPQQSCDIDAQEINSFLDQHVVGQKDAKIVLSVAIANHYKRINKKTKDLEIEKVNILMLGPTGSGKTLLARTVARYLDVPFVIADATSLTEAGYVGDDVESMISRLYNAAGQDIDRCQRGIVFIDEIDKITRKSESVNISRDVSGEGVQQALLKVVEGTRCRITPQGGRKHPSGDTVEIDTTNILFIAGGAFVGLDALIANRTKGTSIGFRASVNSVTPGDLSQQLNPGDLVKFGLIPEFVGRFPTWVTLQELTKGDLIRILQHIKNNYVAQYQWLFEQDDVELRFTPAALDLIADNTLSNKTGARGLHSELERILMPHMYQLASYRKQGIKCVDIDEHMVNNPIQLRTINE